MARKPKAEKSEDETIVEQAHKEFATCESLESETRKLWKADLRFANGDPENGYQWDDAMQKQREIDKRPCLTINKVKQHNRQITNDARQNKPSVRVYPVDDGADKKTAEIFNGIIRHIEANSNADTAYDMAGEFAVDAGLGYWRIKTDYAADDTFDQEIYIEEVPNPLNVYLYGYKKVDGSDATRGFIFDDMPKAVFESKYPDCEAIGWPQSAGDSTEWLGEDKIRVCEYYKIVEESDTLCVGLDGQTFKLSEIEDKEVAKAIKADKSIKQRKVTIKKCKWYLIAGDKIIERTDWLGVYIPIIRVVGEEVEIDGKIQRKGHTRGMKDAQRMYNFWTTSAVEFVALQGKQPYLAPAEAIEGYEEFWNNLNTSNLAYLPYNSFTEDGKDLQAPVRQQPPTMAQAYMSGMQIASEEMKMASGQYDASLGAKSNETSGRAIMARQREGDNATFHFIDNVARAIRFTGKILVDLIPKVYDTARVVRILGEDGKEDKVHIDPQQQQAVIEQEDPLTKEIKEIYNPSVGRYDVIVAVGPSYSTKRQEAFQALTEMTSRNPELLKIAGDIIMKAADFPMAEQLAERMEKTLPPGLKEEKGVDPQVQSLQTQMQQMGQALVQAHQEVSKLEQKDKYESQKIEIEAYKAETERMTATQLAMTPQMMKKIALDTFHEIITSPDPDEQEQQAPPMQSQQPPQGGFLTPNEL